MKREEWAASAFTLVMLLCLHAFVIARNFEQFTGTGRGHWNVFINNFTVSGFDPITYSVVTYWEANYNVYRHPFLSFMVWPLSVLDKWIMETTGVNPVQFIVALPLLFCAFYAFIFIYRTFRDIIQLRAFDSALLSTMLFSYAYVMVAAVVPDHFCVSMFLLLFAVYVSGRKIQAGTTFKIWQAVALFFVTAGVTLSNGIKIYLYSLFTNGRRFFRLKYFLFAVLLPAALIWGFARWEYRTFVKPKEQQRKELADKKNAEKREKMFAHFKDTTALTDSVVIKQAFDREMKMRAHAKYISDHNKPWHLHTGKPMAEGEFMNWTDATTSRLSATVENLFGESVQLHPDHLLEDTLRSRPVVVTYRWAVNYVVEALLVALFIAGIWCGRRSRFLWMALSGFAFDMAIHLGLGFGINEVYIMGAHWLFVMPLAVGFLVRRAGTGRRAVWLRGLLVALTVWLLLFVFGHSIGSNGALMSNFGHYGMQAVMLASACTAGSVLASWLVYVVMFKEKKKGGRQ